MKTTFTIAAITATILAQASGTFSLIEINPLQGHETYLFSDSSKNFYGAGELSNFTEFNSNLYFYAQNAQNNGELWKTDGTPEGTEMVKDINPTGSSLIGNITLVGGKMIFMATDSNNDYDLFSSDGTTGGTVKINELNQWQNDRLSPQRSATFGSNVLFCTNTDLMITDGTSSGTHSILSIQQYSPAQGYCELAGNAYFILTDVMGKPQLWMTNGTTAGTQMAFNLGDTTTKITSVEKLLTFNGKLYIVANNNWMGNDLFEYAGGINGQLTRIDLVPGIHYYPVSVNVSNNRLVFLASDSIFYNHVYSMSTSDVMPQLVASSAAIDVTGALTFCNNAVYFTDNHQHQIYSVDLSNLFLQTIDLGNYYLPNYFFTTESEILAGAGGKIFFAAYDSAGTKQVLMESNGTPQGTFVIMPNTTNTYHPFNQIVGCGTLDIFDLKMWGDKLILPANFNDAGRELWIFEPAATTGVNELNKELEFNAFPNPANSEVTVKTISNGYCDQQLIISDASGEIVVRKTLSGETNSIKLSSLASGNYFATLTENGKAISTKKLVLMK